MVPGTDSTSSPAREAASMVSGPIEAIAASPVRTMATRVLSSGTSRMCRSLKCGRPRQCGVVTAVSSMRSPGTLRTNFQGPLPIGFLRNSSSPTFSI